MTAYFAEAREHSLVDNNSLDRLIPKRELEWDVILLWDNGPKGSAVVHSFDHVMGHYCYRIMSRVCVLPSFYESNPRPTQTDIMTHKFAPQKYLMFGCINAIGDSPCYITTSDSDQASQKKVHNFWTKLMSKLNVLEYSGEIEYRGTKQTVWSVNTKEFMKQHAKYNPQMHT